MSDDLTPPQDRAVRLALECARLRQDLELVTQKLREAGEQYHVLSTEYAEITRKLRDAGRQVLAHEQSRSWCDCHRRYDCPCGGVCDV
ncbi:MAG: hypothetical protein J2P17_08265 [Mycobacterium sp.]|nr:hypothetical protein [Mycobacterium sp.]